MANNGTLTFSLVFRAVTEAFNSAIGRASQNYQQATRDMGTAGNQLGQNTAALSEKLQNVFRATDARGITSAFRAATQELNSMRQGATLTAGELTQLGRAGKSAIQQLTAELNLAQAELRQLRSSRAAPADIDAAKAKVSALRDEIGRAGVVYGQFQTAATAAMRRAATDTQNVESTSRQAGSAIYGMLNIRSDGQLRAEIAGINSQLAQFRQNASVPPGEMSRVTQAAQQHIARLRAEMGGTTPLFGQMAGAIRSIGPAAAVLTGVSIGLASVKQGVEAVLAATIRYEATMKKLEFATGGVDKAAKEYEFLLGVTKRLGIDLNASADGFAKLAASTKGTALEGEKTRVIFEGVASAAASLNLSASDTSGVMLALSQIISKGKVGMDELRQQLGERLPSVMTIAARSIGVTTAQLDKMVESGMDSILFMEAFGPAMVQAFGPTAALNVSTIAGQINLLKTEFELLLVKIGKGGVGQAAIAIFQDLRGALESVNATIDGMDAASVDAVKQVFKQLYDMVGQTFMVLLRGVGDAVTSMRELVNGVLGVVTSFVGIEKSNEQIGLLTRSIQGISILLGVMNDGVKGVDIALTIAIGVAQSFFSAVALGLSKITFGNVSRELQQFAFEMQDKAQGAFTDASKKALEFQSSAVAAADAAISAHTKAGEEVKKAHSDASSSAQVAQVGIATAVKESATAVATAHTVAAGQVVASQGAIGTAAQQTAQVIKLAAIEGARATVGMAIANQSVIDAMTKLGKESGIVLPLVMSSATQAAEVLAEVAAKSDRAAEAIGKNLKNAISELSAKDFVILWDGYVRGLEKAGANTDLLNKSTVEFATQAAKMLGGDLSAALGSLSEGFGDNIKVLDRLIASMDTLKRQGVDTGIALSTSLDGMLSKAKNTSEIKKLIEYWEDLGKKGLVTGQQMRDGLEAARKKMDDMTPGINSVNEALRTLGQTANDTAKNTSDKYTEAFKVLRDSGEATFTQITAGIKTMLDAANNTQSLDKLRLSIQELGREGKLASYDVKQGIADIQNKMDDMTPGINSVNEAFRTFGMMTRQEAAAMADKYGQAFEVMKNSGQASAVELKKAFTQYADAAVSANGGVVSELLQSQAAAQGLQVVIDETGQVIVKALGSGTKAVDDMGMSLERAVDKYGKLSESAKRATEAALSAKEKELEMQERLNAAKQKEIDLENKRKGVDRQGYKVDESGNRIVMTMETWQSIANKLMDGGVSKEQADQMAPALQRQWQGMMLGSGSKLLGTFTQNNNTQSFQDIIENAIASAKNPLAQQKAPLMPQQQSPATRTVNVNMKSGGKRVGVSVSPHDEQQFLDILDTAKGVS